MGMKAELKTARKLLQSGEHEACLRACESLASEYAGTEDDREPSAAAALGMLLGTSALALGDAAKAESGFAAAAAAQPDAPQAWKGLLDALEMSGQNAKLPLPLLHMAEIAENRGNQARARTLRLRAAMIYHVTADNVAAVEALRPSLEMGTATDIPTVAETLQLYMLAAVSASAVETAAGAAKAEKRGAKAAKDRNAVQVAAEAEARGKAAVAAAAGESDFGRWREAALSLLPQAAATSTMLPRLLALEFEHVALCRMADEVALVAVTAAQKRAAWQRVLSACNALLALSVGDAAATGAAAAATGEGGEVAAAAAVKGAEAAGATAKAAGVEPPARLTPLCYASAYHLRAAWFLDAAADADGGASSADSSAAGVFAKSGVALDQESPIQPGASNDDLDGAADSAAAAAMTVAAERAAAASCRSEAGLWLALKAALAGNWPMAASCVAAAKAAGADDWRASCLSCLVICSRPPCSAGGRRGGDGDGISADAVAAVITSLSATAENFGPPLCLAWLEGSLAVGAARAAMRQGRFADSAAALEAAAVPKVHSDLPGRLCVHCEALCAHAQLLLARADSPDGAASAGDAGDVSVGGGVGRVGNEAAAIEALEHYRRVLEQSPAHLEALLECGWLLLSSGHAEGARPMLEAAEAAAADSDAAAVGDRAVAALRLGICYWELGGTYRSDRSRCFVALLRAAKLDPGAADAFAWLGRWYAEAGGDEERAKGCLARAVKIDPCHEWAGPVLAAMYLRRGQEALAMTLFRQSAEASSRAHWAWAGLGRAAMVRGRLSEAVVPLQQALGGSLGRWVYWADLGWVYHGLGKHQAALKAYGRALELLESQAGPAAAVLGAAGAAAPAAAGDAAAVAAAEEAAAARGFVRVLTGMGQAQREVGLVDEAVASFRAALTAAAAASGSDGGGGGGGGGAAVADAVIQHGAAEAMLAQAHARASDGLYGGAADCLAEGVQITKAFLNPSSDSTSPEAIGLGSGGAGGLACGWKVLGDLHTYAHCLPPDCFGGAEGQLQFVARGQPAYEKALALAREPPANVTADAAPSGLAVAGATTGGGGGGPATALAAAAYDLGLNLYLQARLLRLAEGEGSGPWPQEAYDALPQVATLTSAAEAAFRGAVLADPGHADAWNGLGVVSCDPLKRQHCLVRAAQLDRNASAFANLAALYLSLGLEDEAYEALEALRAVADHPVMWVGLGLLKEREAGGAGFGGASNFGGAGNGGSGSGTGSGGSGGGGNDGSGCGGGGSGGGSGSGGGGGGRAVVQREASDAYYAALETSQHPDALVGLALTAWQLGGGAGLADALAALAVAVQVAPANAAAWNLRGCLVLRKALENGAGVAAGSGDADGTKRAEVRSSETVGGVWEAVTCLRRAVSLLERQRETLPAAAAAAAAADGGGDNAAKAAAMVANDAALSSASANLADALLFAGDAAAAAAAYQRAAAISGAGTAPSNNALSAWQRAAVGLGRALTAAGRHADAEVIWAAAESAGGSRVAGAVAASKLVAIVGDAAAAAAAAAAASATVVAQAAAVSAAARRLAEIQGSGSGAACVAALGSAMAAAALVDNAPLAMAASRRLRQLLLCGGGAESAESAGPGGADPAAARQSYWLSAYATQRIAGAPPRTARRALLRAVHELPESPRAWLVLGATLLDDAVATCGTGSSPAAATASDDANNAASDIALARRCASVALLLMRRELLGMERHFAGCGSSGGAGAADGAPGAVAPLTAGAAGFDAHDYASALGMAAAADAAAGRCPPWEGKPAASGKAGKGGEDGPQSLLAAVAAAGRKDGSASAGLRQLQRALRMYPADMALWRLLALAHMRRVLLPTRPSLQAEPSLLPPPSTKEADADIAADGDATVGDDGGLTIVAPAPADLLRDCLAIYRMAATAETSCSSSGTGAADRDMAGLESVHVAAVLAAAEPGTEAADAAGELMKELERGSALVQRPGLQALAQARVLALGCSNAGGDGDGGSCPWQDAVEAYKAAVAADPALAVAWQELSALYDLRGKPTAAEAALRCGLRALEALQPPTTGGSGGDSGGGGGVAGCKATGLLLRLAALLARQGRNPEAREAADAAAAAVAAAAGERISGPDITRAACWLAAGKPKKATDLLQKAAVINASVPALARLAAAAAAATVATAATAAAAGGTEGGDSW